MRPHSIFTTALAGALSAVALTGPPASAHTGPPDRPQATTHDARRALPGPPTWPAHPQRIGAPGASDGGDSAALIIGLAGAAAAAGATALVGFRRRVFRSRRETGPDSDRLQTTLRIDR
jgi:hypothetical protein